MRTHRSLHFVKGDRGMKRPYSFSDIKGQEGIVNFLKNNLQNGTLSHFLIFEGPEGTGKTSIADILALNIVYGDPASEEYAKAYKEIVCKSRSNDFIKRFECSEEGGKDAARLIKDEMSNTFKLSRPKVIICDECHGLTEQAQDVFLSKTEFVDSNVYIIMLTTEFDKLKPSLKSRAFPMHFMPLKRSEMLELLRQEVASKNLNIQNLEATIQMIADWSECKPRAGLNIIDAFGAGTSVSLDTIRSLIGYLDAKDAVPLLKSLSGSMTFGLSFIDQMVISPNLITIVNECIALKSGNPSYRLKLSDVQYIKQELQFVSTEQLVMFLFGITKQPKLSKATLINAYIRAHASFNVLTTSDTSDKLQDELVQRANVEMQDPMKNTSHAPTLDELFSTSDIVE